MKATTIIIAAIFSLQAGFLFAGNNEGSSSANSENGFCTICALAPVAPAEATFEEGSLTEVVTFDITMLAPETPSDADFSENAAETIEDLTALAPVTPAEADFPDDTSAQTAGPGDMASTNSK